MVKLKSTVLWGAECLMKNGNLPPAQLKPEGNWYLTGSGQFLRRTPVLLTGYATALSVRTSLSLISYTSKCGIQVIRREHTSNARELVKMKQADTDIAIILAKAGPAGKAHTAQQTGWLVCCLSPRDHLWSLELMCHPSGHLVRRRAPAGAVGWVKRKQGQGRWKEISRQTSWVCTVCQKSWIFFFSHHATLLKQWPVIVSNTRERQGTRNMT